MKAKLILPLIISFVYFNSHADSCFKGTINSAWPLKQSYSPALLSLGVKSGNLERFFAISQVFLGLQRIGQIKTTWDLRDDLYGPASVSLVVRYPGLEKSFVTKKGQSVCVYQLSSSYALEFLD